MLAIAVALQHHCNRLLRSGTHIGHPIHPQRDRFSVCTEDDVAGLEPCPQGGALFNKAADHRQHRWHANCHAEGLQQVRLFLSPEPLRNRHLGLGQRVRLGITHGQFQGTRIPQTLQQREIDCGHRRRFTTVNRDDFLTHFQSRRLRQRVGSDRLDYRDDPHLSPEKQHPQHHNGQPKIGNRPRGGNGHPFAHGLTVVRARTVCLCDLAVALIRHTNITAKWNGRDHVLGVVFTPPSQQRPAEADGKSQHLDARAARHPEMAVFMDRHNDGESRHGNEYGLQRV